MLTSTPELLSLIKLKVEAYSSQAHALFYRFDHVNAAALDDLRRIRRNFAEEVLSLEASLVLPQLGQLLELGVVHAVLLDCGLLNEELRAEERTFLDQLLVKLNQESNTPQQAALYLAVALLYADFYRLNLQEPLSFILSEIGAVFLKWICRSPKVFLAKRDAKRYHQFVSELCHSLRQITTLNPDRHGAAEIGKAILYHTHWHVLPLVLSDSNSKEIIKFRAELIEFVMGAQIDFNFTARSQAGGKIRLGVLEDLFHTNPDTATIRAILSKIDRKRFDVTLIATFPSDQVSKEIFAKLCDRFVVFQGEVPDQVAQIRELDLDMLLVPPHPVDFEPMSFLVAHRLARLQIGLPSSAITSGYRSVDIQLHGQQISAELLAAEYVEEPVSLGCWAPAVCYDVQDEALELRLTAQNFTRETLGIDQSELIFVSNAKAHKIVPELSEAWVEILCKVPNSVLVLAPYQVTPAFLGAMQRLFERFGLAARRLIMLKATGRSNLLNLLSLADIYLDSFPYSGSTSLLDPLKVGLPIVTLKSKSFVSQLGAAMIESLNINHDQMIARDIAAYIDQAVRIASEPELRRNLAWRIKERMQQPAAFLDADKFSAHFCACLERLYKERVEARF